MINYPSMYSFLFQLHFVSNPFHCLTSGLKSKGFPVDFVDQFKCKIRGYESFKFTFSFWERQVLFRCSSFSLTFETCSENRKLLRKLQSIRDMFLNNWVSGNEMNKKWWITGIIEGSDDKRKSFQTTFNPRLTVFQNIWGSLFFKGKVIYHQAFSIRQWKSDSKRTSQVDCCSNRNIFLKWSLQTMIAFRVIGLHSNGLDKSNVCWAIFAEVNGKAMSMITLHFLFDERILIDFALKSIEHMFYGSNHTLVERLSMTSSWERHPWMIPKKTLFIFWIVFGDDSDTQVVI